jgi:hypothetical protein
MSRIGLLGLCSLMIAGGLAAGQAARGPLADGLFLQGVDGRLVRDDVNDVWLLDLTTDINTPAACVPAETDFRLLPSATLDSMADDSGDRVTPLYRLSVLVTQYRGKNYLLPTYYLPLSRLKEPNEPQQATGGRGPVIGIEPNSTLPIPGEIAEQLKNRGPLQGQQRLTPDSSPTAPTRALVDIVGFIEQREGHAVFTPNALGLDVSATEYLLLPNATLEQAQRIQAASPDRVRFSVSGLLSEFKGKQYLLVQRATRVYSFGDFTG